MLNTLFSSELGLRKRRVLYHAHSNAIKPNMAFKMKAIPIGVEKQVYHSDCGD